MKKHLATVALALLVGVLGFAAAGVAVAGNGKPPLPPGQGECEHGNSGMPCKDDPQPDNGKDCEEHGNQGGVNEDHCTSEEATDTTDTTDTTETTETTTTPDTTTTTETTETTQTTQTTAPTTETTATTTTEANEQASSQAPKPTSDFVGKPPVATPAQEADAVLGVAASGAPKPTRQPQRAPLTL